jgi:hypothetical protein
MADSMGKSKARKIAEHVYLNLLTEDGLRLVTLLGQGRYSVPLDSQALAALEVAISEGMEKFKYQD